MTFAFALVISLILGVSTLISILSPYVIAYNKKATVKLASIAKWLRVLSLFVIAVILFNSLGISTINHNTNVIIVIIAVLCYGLLALFSFKLKWFIGLLSLLMWFLVIIYLLIDLLAYDNSPQIKTLEDNMYCRKSLYGFVTSDSGTDVEVFKRYWFIDKLVVSQRNSDVQQMQMNSLSFSELELLKSCWKE